MNWPTLVLVVLIALLQYPLWLGKGGWLRVWDYDRQLQAQRDTNQKLEQRNAALDAEVRDLKSGYEAIEERARYELGMIKEGEIFVQVPQKTLLAPSSQPSPAPSSTLKPAAKPAVPR
ncbi:MAG: cell division protein FtsB [Rhodocyclaceae bacterium]|nr:MAG: cell division protein FtsB [Rhodocyclaceae bacterium]TND05219.1 MAG: cell division protein FtsB [Rhodocyclaceae bacterium]